jgi:hypothetical protein
MKADENLEAADAAISAGGDALSFREFASAQSQAGESRGLNPGLRLWRGRRAHEPGDNEELGGQVRGDLCDGSFSRMRPWS